MFGTAKHFAVGAAASVATGLALGITERAAALSGAEPPPSPLDAAHLLTVGTALFVVGGLLVATNPALTPDPALRKGPAPRAFWAIAAGVLAFSWAWPRAKPADPFFSALALGASFLELAAIGLLVVPLLRPAGGKSAPPPPEPSLTPPDASGTEDRPRGGS